MATEPTLFDPGWLTEGLSAWIALPIGALDGPFAALALFIFGCLHALLPGHGKMLLAAHAAAAETDRAKPAVLVLDGIALACARVLVAFALVVVAVQAANAFGLTVPIASLRVLAGCVLIGIGAHFAWHALACPRALGVATGPVLPEATVGTDDGARGGLSRSLIVLALTPEPVALAIASYGVLRNELPLAAVASLGMALGMGLTLGAVGVVAGMRRHRFVLLGRAAGLPIAAILFAAGAIIIIDAWA